MTNSTITSTRKELMKTATQKTQTRRVIPTLTSPIRYQPGDPSAELGAKLKWNSEADEYNQWEELGQDERESLISEFILQNASRQQSLPAEQPRRGLNILTNQTI
jgi:hypothetical protein